MSKWTTRLGSTTFHFSPTAPSWRKAKRGAARRRHGRPSACRGRHAQRLGAFCRYKTGLSLRLSELAILVTAARWQAQAEWYIHYPIALKAGVPEVSC